MCACVIGNNACIRKKRQLLRVAHVLLLRSVAGASDISVNRIFPKTPFGEMAELTGVLLERYREDKLISAREAHSSLYDITSKTYSNRIIKRAALEEIGKDLCEAGKFYA